MLTPTNKMHRKIAALLLASVSGALSGYAQSNVIQPGDPIIASSSNSPGSEGVANAIDGTQAKYLNFDSANDAKVTGFIVSPSVGSTWVTGLLIKSANDAPDRDPKAVTLEGSNDATVSDFTSGNWTTIATIDDIQAWSDKFPGDDRYKDQTFTFANTKPYLHYRWTVTKTQGPSTCCMQVAEVQLLGSALPQNVVQPGDPIIASSSNSPGSEGVANAVDNTQAKYLNFDSANDAKPSGFVVSPSVGATVVNGLSIQSANDAPDRDPKAMTLEGSNDDAVSDFGSGNWTKIADINDIPAWSDVFPGDDRYKTQTFLFDNVIPYKHYRWTVTKTQGPSTCCLQVAEVQLLGSGAPANVVLPGDSVIASSSNSPGSEGVANAVDGTQAKYLNFDSANDAKASGFVVTPSVGPTTITGIGIESANDAPDRDVKAFTVEGSNDDTVTDFASGTWNLIASVDNITDWPTLFPNGDRYQWQYFYFTNKVAYKHYRWTATKTQGPSTCCLQVAEVQFLAVTSKADCNKAQFILQPVNTPVLEGTSATFFAGVNGPWPLQWSLNGKPIPGATKTTLTTDPVTTANQTNVYTVQIVGCETSQPVQATVFTPSSTKSIAISFAGGGANGAPTAMLTNDIAGVQLQGYWNNANAGTGSVGDGSSLPDALLDSSGDASPVTFEFTTSGTWGAGTGSDSPTQRMLNGLVGANTPGNVGTFMFHNVPAGNHSVLVYAVSPPLQFQLVRFTIGNTSYFMRTMTSDEYKGTPGFYRGFSTDKNNPTIGDFVRFDNVQAVNGDITLEIETLTPGFDRQTGVNALQLVLNAPAPGAPPAITQDPQPAVAPTGGVATLTVAATGENLTYQWRKNEFGNPTAKTVINGGAVSGATTSTLTINGVGPEHEGVYSVAVFNQAGSVISKNAAVHISNYNIQDALASYWKLDETSGTSAANAVASGKPIVFIAAPAWGGAQVGNGATLNGGTYGQADSYTPAKTAISGSAWVNAAPNAFASEVIFRNAQGDLVPRGGAVEGVKFGQFELRLAIDANNGNLLPEAAIQIGPNVARVTAPAALPTGSWHQIAFTADGAQLRLYVDGKQVAVTDYLANINVPDIPYITVGAQYNYTDPADTTSPVGLDPTNPNLFAGSIDELALWGRALTAEEVGSLYTAEKAGKDLTTVQETAPPTGGTGGTLSAAVSAGKITITWDKGALQSAPSVNGPWTDVPNAASPFSDTLADAAKFYRTK